LSKMLFKWKRFQLKVMEMEVFQKLKASAESFLDYLNSPEGLLAAEFAAKDLADTFGRMADHLRDATEYSKEFINNWNDNKFLMAVGWFAEKLGDGTTAVGEYFDEVSKVYDLYKAYDKGFIDFGDFASGLNKLDPAFLATKHHLFDMVEGSEELHTHLDRVSDLMRQMNSGNPFARQSANIQLMEIHLMRMAGEGKNAKEAIESLREKIVKIAQVNASILETSPVGEVPWSVERRNETIDRFKNGIKEYERAIKKLSHIVRQADGVNASIEKITTEVYSDLDKRFDFWQGTDTAISKTTKKQKEYASALEDAQDWLNKLTMSAYEYKRLKLEDEFDKLAKALGKNNPLLVKLRKELNLLHKQAVGIQADWVGVNKEISGQYDSARNEAVEWLEGLNDEYLKLVSTEEDYVRIKDAEKFEKLKEILTELDPTLAAIVDKMNEISTAKIDNDLVDFFENLDEHASNVWAGIDDDTKERIEQTNEFIADNLMTLMDEGFEGVWENFEDYGKRAIAELAAEEIRVQFGLDLSDMKGSLMDGMDSLLNYTGMGGVLEGLGLPATAAGIAGPAAAAVVAIDMA